MKVIFPHYERNLQVHVNEVGVPAFAPLVMNFVAKTLINTQLVIPAMLPIE